MEGKRVSETQVTISHSVSPLDANISGNVHGGVIMKLIDEAGGVVAMRHSRSNTVTASVDRIDFHHPAFIGELLTLKASLNLVGRSSMEVGVRVEAENTRTGEIRHIASAYLTFVSLDDERQPSPVPPLILEDAETVRRNRDAMERRRIRLSQKQKEDTHHG